MNKLLVKYIYPLPSQWGWNEQWDSLFRICFLVFIMIILTLFVRLISNVIVNKPLSRIVEKSRFRWDNVALQSGVFKHTINLIPAIFLWNMLIITFPDAGTIHLIVRKAVSLWILVVFSKIILSVIDMFHVLYNRRPTAIRHPIKGVVQAFNIVIIVAITLIGIAVITGSPLSGVLGGLGALSAVIMLIFKDPILGLYSGVQLAANDMVSIGDWIEVPNYGADGDVIDIGLQTVTVQNWDKTYSTIPVSDLLSGTFKNWRGMSHAGGRRIKRSIPIDMNSIHFLSEEEIKELEDIHILKLFLQERQDEILKWNKTNNIDEENKTRVNGRQMTNIGVFRSYVMLYLKSQPTLHKNMTMLVRQLTPGPQGLPLEIYVFTNNINWGEFENIQSDIFDHLLASLSHFGLRVFQEPTGRDIAGLHN